MSRRHWRCHIVSIFPVELPGQVQRGISPGDLQRLSYSDSVWGLWSGGDAELPSRLCQFVKSCWEREVWTDPRIHKSILWERSSSRTIHKLEQQVAYQVWKRLHEERARLSCYMERSSATWSNKGMNSGWVQDAELPTEVSQTHESQTDLCHPGWSQSWVQSSGFPTWGTPPRPFLHQQPRLESVQTRSWGKPGEIKGGGG